MIKIIIVPGDPKMNTLTYALIGFLAGLFTMTIISLYRFVLKKA